MIPFKDLPKPDGKFLIGTDILILEDVNRTESFTKEYFQKNEKLHFRCR